MEFLRSRLIATPEKVDTSQPYKIAMNFRQYFYRYVLRRIEDRVKGERVLTYLKILEPAQWWSRKVLDEYRLERLKQLTEHAYTHVPFYRKSFDSVNLTPSKISSLSDLLRVPVLSRGDLRKHYSKGLRSAVHDFSRCIKGSSSGSSGDPVTYFKDLAALSSGRAAGIVGFSMAGWRLGDSTMTVWGNFNTVTYEWSRLGSQIKAFLYREKRIPAFQLTTGPQIQRSLLRIISSGAKFLYGYSNAIYVLALAAQERRLRPKRPFLGVFTTAETLSPQARSTVETVFGPVYDGYGCGEILGIAFQCEAHKGYHIVEPNVIVEFEDIGLGDYKGLIVTDLTNYAMPLIRYRVGDIGVPDGSRCPCGRTWQTLAAIHGRTCDIIKTPKGGNLLIPSVFGSTLLKQVPGIAQYQLALVSEDTVVLRIVPKGKFNYKDIEAIRRSLKPYLHNVINYSVKPVQSIPISPNGKHKLVVDERP